MGSSRAGVAGMLKGRDGLGLKDNAGTDGHRSRIWRSQLLIAAGQMGNRVFCQVVSSPSLEVCELMVSSHWEEMRNVSVWMGGRWTRIFFPESGPHEPFCS